MSGDLQTETYYADRDDKFLKEQPYELKFLPPEVFPLSNMTWSRYDGIHVTDIRGHEDRYNARDTGFQLTPMKTKLAYEDFDEPLKVEHVYMKEVAECLQSTLNASRVLAFDYNIRKSQVQYPLSSGEAASFETPATIVHIGEDTEAETIHAVLIAPDSTQSWTARMHNHYCESEPDLAKFSRYQYVKYDGTTCCTWDYVDLDAKVFGGRFEDLSRNGH
ncbi:hypothetical protein CERZMDRAFT_103538 [Cercospora zeae-maydis SCOH1-5]|uniref:Uncharacterized protein n=1 Tax=Cercospora zeae-maydis SCOH1-5 TaxID=717836 RepID=A0A6A6EVG9_9PEZI|nr:hypothetical protein CERZMDRAFT_103538 [Cercospora zeae-maydis SCOH1-5]